VKGVVVDTGATVSAIPAAVAKELGIKFPVSRKFLLADGRTSAKRVGSAWIELDERKASTEIIAPTKGRPLLSVLALESLGFTVDPKTRTLKKQEVSLLL
jgi:predicted aspartyl protease